MHASGTAAFRRRGRFAPPPVFIPTPARPYMMRLQRTVPLLALALALGGASAAAQTIPSPYRHIETSQRIGAFGGYLFLSPDVSVTDTSSVPIGAASAPVLGVRYGVRATGPLDFQVSLGVSPSTRQLWSPQVGADSVVVVPVDLETSVPATLVMLDLGLRFGLTGDRTWNDLAPYVSASAGMVADARGSFAEEDAIPAAGLFRFGPSFALGGALGTDWFPATRTSLRLELQGMLWRTTTPAGFAPLRATTRNEWKPGAGVTVGAAFHF